MKSFIFFCILFINAAICFSQDDFFKIGAGLNFAVTPTNNNKYVGTNLCYQSYHHTPKENLYITSGTSVLFSVSPHSLLNFMNANDILFFSVRKRLGLSFTSKKENSHKTYYNIGSELNFTGLYFANNLKIGFYANADFFLKSKKDYFVITPEINVINPFPANKNYGLVANPYILVGCNIGYTSKGSLIPGEFNDLKSITNPFSIDLFTSYSNNKYNKTYNYKETGILLNLSANYRLFKHKIFSPEFGLMFLYADGKYINLSDYVSPDNLKVSFTNFNEYALALKIGGSLQTKGKVAFISNFAAYPFLTSKGLGCEGSMGIKVRVTNKLALSTSFQVTNYIGDIRGKYEIYGIKDNTPPEIILYSNKVMHTIYQTNIVSGIKFGVHF